MGEEYQLKILSVSMRSELKSMQLKPQSHGAFIPGTGRLSLCGWCDQKLRVMWGKVPIVGQRNHPATMVNVVALLVIT